MSDKTGLHLETLAISHGYDPQSGQGAAKPPRSTIDRWPLTK